MLYSKKSDLGAISSAVPILEKNYKRESFLPHIMDRGYLALDKDPLAKEMRKRAKSMYPKLMREYKAPEISADIVRQMDEIIAR